VAYPRNGPYIYADRPGMLFKKLLHGTLVLVRYEKIQIASFPMKRRKLIKETKYYVCSLFIL
jgi:hypothetical protein